jgi:hypothetical protein
MVPYNTPRPWAMAPDGIGRMTSLAWPRSPTCCLAWRSARCTSRGDRQESGPRRKLPVADRPTTPRCLTLAVAASSRAPGPRLGSGRSGHCQRPLPASGTESASIKTLPLQWPCQSRCTTAPSPGLKLPTGSMLQWLIVALGGSGLTQQASSLVDLAQSAPHLGRWKLWSRCSLRQAHRGQAFPYLR